MLDTKQAAVDPAWAWAPYQPSAEQPWNLPRVGHLLRRAGFGATQAEMDAALADGPTRSVQRLIEGGPNQEAFDRSTAAMAESIARGNNGKQLRAWWLYRMLYSPHPLQEKLTLCLHNHFATSNAKVQNAGFMLKQYQLLRQHALGNFGDLLTLMSRDPAMLIWLDGKASQKGYPNENYARELMELFSLGIGHYTEKDIREAARAFTGWEIHGQVAHFNAKEHDDGQKTVLGQTGPWSADDIVRICLEQPASAGFVVTKIFRCLISDSLPATPELLEPLTSAFRRDGWNLGTLVKTMLASNLFFSPAVYRTRVKSPVEFALGIVRGLEGRIGTSALAEALETLGQNVFYPPSVKGWDGGQTWLNGQTLLFRQNLARALTSTEDGRFGNHCDPAALLRGKPNSAVDYFLRLFLDNDVPPATRQRLLDYAKNASNQPAPVFWTAADASDHRLRTLCFLVLSLPEFQLS